jgi:hypothetical protein
MPKVEEAIAAIVTALSDGKPLLFCGNGGSASVEGLAADRATGIGPAQRAARRGVRHVAPASSASRFAVERLAGLAGLDLGEQDRLFPCSLKLGIDLAGLRAGRARASPLLRAVIALWASAPTPST